MSTQRKDRVSQGIRDGLAELIAREVKDPRVSAAGFVGINHVEVNRDLSVARVYVSFFGGDSSERATERAMAGLQAVAGFLRGHVARRLGLKRAPELKFFHDTSPDFHAHLDEIRRDDERGAAAAVQAPPSTAGEGTGDDGTD
jgi:ribosome-binding factor A